MLNCYVLIVFWDKSLCILITAMVQFTWTIYNIHHLVSSLYNGTNCPMGAWVELSWVGGWAYIHTVKITCIIIGYMKSKIILLFKNSPVFFYFITWNSDSTMTGESDSICITILSALLKTHFLLRIKLGRYSLLPLNIVKVFEWVPLDSQRLFNY